MQGCYAQVSRLTGPRVVLLGDAAHAVSAAFGQGVNSALEVGASQFLKAHWLTCQEPHSYLLASWPHV